MTPFIGSSWSPLPTSSTSLRLQVVRKADSGSYACSASNGVGEDLFAAFHVGILGMSRVFSTYSPLELPALHVREDFGQSVAFCPPKQQLRRRLDQLG